MSLTAGGVLSGTPGAIGSYTFTVTATDARSSSAARTYTLNVNVLTLDITPASLGDTAAGVPYSVVLSGAGGTAPYTFAVAAGSTLPSGLALSANGSLTGIVSFVGQYNFTIKVTDGNGQAATRTYNLKVVVNAVVIDVPIADGAYGKQYDQFFTSSAGTAPYVYSLSGGTLPTGLQLANTGELYGTPTLAGSFSFWITAVDRVGNMGTYPFTVTIAQPTIAMIPDDLFAATSGLFYSVTMNASGGIGTYIYTLASGTLPPGLTLATNGTISGIPNAAPGLFSFSVSDRFVRRARDEANVAEACDADAPRHILRTSDGDDWRQLSTNALRHRRDGALHVQPRRRCPAGRSCPLIGRQALGLADDRGYVDVHGLDHRRERDHRAAVVPSRCPDGVAGGQEEPAEEGRRKEEGEGEGQDQVEALG